MSFLSSISKSRCVSRFVWVTNEWRFILKSLSKSHSHPHDLPFPSLICFCGISVQVKDLPQVGCHLVWSLLGRLHFFYFALVGFAYPHSTITILLTHVKFNVLYGFTYCVRYLFNLILYTSFFSIPLLVCRISERPFIKLLVDFIFWLITIDIVGNSREDGKQSNCQHSKLVSRAVILYYLKPNLHKTNNSVFYSQKCYAYKVYNGNVYLVNIFLLKNYMHNGSIPKFFPFEISYHISSSVK